MRFKAYSDSNSFKNTLSLLLELFTTWLSRRIIFNLTNNPENEFHIKWEKVFSARKGRCTSTLKRLLDSQIRFMFYFHYNSLKNILSLLLELLTTSFLWKIILYLTNITKKWFSYLARKVLLFRSQRHMCFCMLKNIRNNF